MLTPWKESYDQPRQHIKKQRHYFANKGLSSQGDGFSSGHVWFWTVKKIEHQRIDAFDLCWRRLLRVPWRARRSNQSILREINSEYSSKVHIYTSIIHIYFKYICIDMCIYVYMIECIHIYFKKTEVEVRVYIYICMTDLCCRAETNTTLQNYPPIKKKY